MLGVILLLGGIYLLLQKVSFLLTPSGERLVALALILAGFVIVLLRPGRI